MIVYQVELLDIKDESNEVLEHSSLYSNRMTAEEEKKRFQEMNREDIRKGEVCVTLRQHYIIED